MVYAKFCASKIWRSPSVVRQHARAHTLLLAVAWKVGGGAALKILLRELHRACRGNTIALDCILHNEQVVSLKADSYRMKECLRVGAVGFE